LCIAGPGLAVGYLNNPELTSEKFIKAGWQLPVGSRQKEKITDNHLYRTGDLARWLHDGNIEFLGRIDFQVKIRGFRIELGEIENRMMELDIIAEAVVIDRTAKDNEKYLCAYIVTNKKTAGKEIKKRQKKTGQIDTSLVREHLQKSMPDYMVPAYFVQIDTIPLTPGGKVDRKKLPEPQLQKDKTYNPPGDAIEEKLAEIWAEVLGIEKNIIGIEANFFQMGGHSLKATLMIARLRKELNVELNLVEIFKNTTLKGLADIIKNRKKSTFISIEPAEKKEYYPMSSAQKRLYLIQRMELDSTAYNMPQAFPIQKTDRQKLENRFRYLIKRHESLRTSFHMYRDKPAQEIHPAETIKFKIENYEVVTSEPGDTGGSSEWGNRFIRPFDMTHPPLLRVGLIKITTGAEHHHMLAVDMHHIISDGLSNEILKEDFHALYNGKTLTPLKIQYKDYSEWQYRIKGKKNQARQEAYWLETAAGEIPVLELPVDYRRPEIQRFEGDDVAIEIATPQTGKLKQIALESGSTLYMVILAIFNILLSRLAGQEDIIVGTPVAGRRHADLFKIIGMFVNTLPLRNYPASSKTFGEFLDELKGTTSLAFENQEYPFEELVEKVSVNRDASRNPLFDVMFNHNNIDEDTEGEKSGERKPGSPPGEKQKQGKTPGKETEYIRQVAKFDITLNSLQKTGNLFLAFQYSTSLFKAKTIARFVSYFEKILSSVIQNPNVKLANIRIMSEEEKKRILYEFNDTEIEFPGNKTIHGLFEEQAEKTPDNIAVALAGTSLEEALTYKELKERAGTLAGKLREKGVTPGTIAAILVERSVNMVIGLLGILQAGGTYLPIEPAYPEERIKYMLTDSNAKILLTTHSIEKKNPLGKNTLYLEELKELQEVPGLENGSPHPGSGNAYIIYTSGSTGRPKGVLVRHKGFINLIHSHWQVFGENNRDRISQVASPAFDAMAAEVWPCLTAGAALYIATSDVRADSHRLKQWLIENGITLSFQSTAVGELLLKEEWPKTGVALRALRLAGDRLKRYPGRTYPFRLYNLYGPTEDTVWTTYTEVPTAAEAGIPGAPSIGKPIANHRVYIMDPYLNLQPVGVAGELCIAGTG
ncbi:MAG: AMP-binding protein, partial [bacterium]|nr:AMP-binding protein [bacterium]